MNPSTPTDIAIVSAHVDPKDFPHDHASEKSFLGCLVSAMQQGGESCLLNEEEMWQATPEWFHHPYHSLVYSVLGRLWHAREPVTVAAVGFGISQDAILAELPPTADLFDARRYPATDLSRHLREVRAKYLQRLLIEWCGSLIVRASENMGADEVDKLLEEAQRRVLALAPEEAEGGGNGGQPLHGLVMDALERVEKLYEKRGVITGMSTGFPPVDDLLDGLQPGDLIVLAGRPSMGKSSLARNLVEHIAVKEKRAAMVFTPQTPAVRYVQSMLCSLSVVNLQRVRDGFMSERDFPSMTNAASKMAESKIYLDDTADVTIEALRAKVRAGVKLHGIELVVIDSLQHLRSAAVLRQGGTRATELTEVVLGLKAMDR